MRTWMIIAWNNDEWEQWTWMIITWNNDDINESQSIFNKDQNLKVIFYNDKEIKKMKNDTKLWWANS